MSDIREHFSWDAGKNRRAFAAAKLELFNGEHEKTLHKVIGRRFTNQSVADKVCKWASTSRNLLRQITRTVAISYARGCVRTLKDASPETASAFARIVAESKIGGVAPKINQYAWVLGPTFVLPQVEADGSFYLDIVAPSVSDVRLINPQKIGELLYQRSDGLFCRWTPDTIEFYDSEGEAKTGIAPVVHGLGYAPVSIWRSEHWTGDWWNSSAHKALLDASYDIGVLDAVLGWKSKNGGKQVAITAPRAMLGGKQTIGDLDAPLFFDGVSGDSKIEVIDLADSATVGNYIEQINNKVVGICELYGLPPNVISNANSNVDWGTVGLARAPEVLDALRDEQTPWMRDGERDLWAATCDLLRASIHADAGKLPPGDEVRDMLMLRYLEPAVDAEKRIKRLDLFEREEKLGIASATDLVLNDQPSLTAEEADQIITANLDRHLARLDKLAARNIPRGTGDAMESVAQAQGRLGGLTGGGRPPAETYE